MGEGRPGAFRAAADREDRGVTLTPSIAAANAHAGERCLAATSGTPRHSREVIEAGTQDM